AFLLEERADLAARGEPLADARAAQVTHCAADVDPRAHPYVAIESAVALLEEKARMHPAVSAAIERKRLADLGDVRVGLRCVVVGARRAGPRARGWPRGAAGGAALPYRSPGSQVWAVRRGSWR